METGEAGRLEDLISLAKDGHLVEASAELKRHIVTPKGHPDHIAHDKNETEMYILLAEFNFKAASEFRKVAKIYAFGTLEEPIDSTEQNLRFADERLRIDYERLRDANIAIEEVYFREGAFHDE